MIVGEAQARGDGGRVVIECTADYNTLTHLSGRRFEAERGGDAVARRSGAGGADALVREFQRPTLEGIVAGLGS